MASGELVRASAFASGKVILLGEHVVVHGHPGLVAAIDRGVRVTVSPLRPGEAAPARDERLARPLALAQRLLGLDARGVALEVAGDLPIGMGLGSSAALAVALVRALAASAGRALRDEEVAAHAHEIERLFHGTPSGIDSTAATHGGVLWFEAGPPPSHRSVAVAAPLALVVVLSRTAHTTARTVGGLRERAAAAPEVYRPVFAAIAALVVAARAALEGGEAARLGELMTMNHGLLRACGVSTPELDALVEDALAAGALGAKLTGGGGGGAVIALPAGDPASLCAALAAGGGTSFVATIGTAAGAP